MKWGSYAIKGKVRLREQSVLFNESINKVMAIDQLGEKRGDLFIVDI